MQKNLPVSSQPQNRAERRAQARNLVPVATWEQRQPNFKRSTMYKWQHTSRFPGLFIKISGRLFVDEDVFDRIVEQGRQG
jgi:hypothetical protein